MSNRLDRSKWMNMDKALAIVAALGVDACWPWPGCVGDKGYGVVFHDGKQRKAHRVAYERLVGPIPRRLEPDHTCRNRACFNPQHLDVVTHAVNTLRGDGVGAKNAVKTECVNGHPFDDENSYTYTRKNGAKMRVCRRCKLEDSWRRRGKLPTHSRSRVSATVP